MSRLERRRLEPSRRQPGARRDARAGGCRYIGCQRVQELDGDRRAYYQARFWARVELDAFRPEHEMTARRLVAPGKFRTTLFWGAEASAGLILARGLAIERGDRGAAGG